MMPWEHAIVGYIAYSLFVHAVYSESPTTRGTVVVIFASILPDLIDKPLAWQFDIFASGHALGHSVFFAIPLALIAAYLGRVHEQRSVCGAFTLGYLLHLPGDVVPQYLLGSGFQIERLLWPVRSRGTGYEAGFREEFVTNLNEYLYWILEQITSGNPDPYLYILLGTVCAGVLLWIYDGLPIGRELYYGTRWVAKTVIQSVRSD